MGINSNTCKMVHKGLNRLIVILAEKKNDNKWLATIIGQQ